MLCKIDDLSAYLKIKYFRELKIISIRLCLLRLRDGRGQGHHEGLGGVPQESLQGHPRQLRLQSVQRIDPLPRPLDCGFRHRRHYLLIQASSVSVSPFSFLAD